MLKINSEIYKYVLNNLDREGNNVSTLRHSIMSRFSKDANARAVCDDAISNYCAHYGIWHFEVYLRNRKIEVENSDKVMKDIMSDIERLTFS
jgi:hypothetical protein